MIQAARSGKQNILEGSQASGTSRETEIKLVNVARASLQELLEDYRDFLRIRNTALWDKNSREALFVRKLGSQQNVSYETYRTYIETRPPEIVANIVICLIHQTNYLLDQQLRRLEKDFLENGGLRENMTCARLRRRDEHRGGSPLWAMRGARQIGHIGHIRPIYPIGLIIGNNETHNITASPDNFFFGSAAFPDPFDDARPDRKGGGCAPLRFGS